MRWKKERKSAPLRSNGILRDQRVGCEERRRQFSAVDFPAVTNLHERDHARVIVYSIDHPIISLADAIVIMPG
jgi:hypothetical protein